MGKYVKGSSPDSLWRRYRLSFDHGSLAQRYLATSLKQLQSVQRAGDNVELCWLSAWRAPAKCERYIMINLWLDGVCCARSSRFFPSPHLPHLQHEWKTCPPRCSECRYKRRYIHGCRYCKWSSDTSHHKLINWHFAQINYYTSAGNRTTSDAAIPVKPNSSIRFTGRSDILAKLKDHFTSESRDKLRRRKFFLLYGMGGIGKTQICLRFIEDMSD